MLDVAQEGLAQAKRDVVALTELAGQRDHV